MPNTRIHGIITGSGIQMSSEPEIITTLSEILGDLLSVYDERVSDEGPFNDLRVKRQVHYGDPDTTSPGLLEVVVMSMDEKLNPVNRTMRFVAVRVKKSSRGGTVSSTCYHGTKESLRTDLEREKRTPALLLERVEELASGLPEETNSNLWR